MGTEPLYESTRYEAIQIAQPEEKKKRTNTNDIKNPSFTKKPSYYTPKTEKKFDVEQEALHVSNKKTIPKFVDSSSLKGSPGAIVSNPGFVPYRLNKKPEMNELSNISPTAPSQNEIESQRRNS